jgi:4-amino-4-deoxy-L-arabinose transferase-like glycosyltransferase
MAVSAPTAPAAGRGRAASGPSPGPRSARLLRWAPAAIVLAYLATRLALVWRFPPFWDEAGYGEWAYAANHGAATRWQSMLEGKEPLTSWLGALWVHAGVPYLRAVRLVSVLAGLVTLGMLWLVGRRFGRPVALTAMALYALLPVFVVHDAQGIMEPTVTAAALCALYLAIRLAERPAVDVALLLGLAAGVGILTKRSGLFAVAMVPLALLVFDWRPQERARRLAAWAGATALAATVAAGCYAILALSPNWETYKLARSQFNRPIGDVLSDPWAPISANGDALFPALAGYVGPLLMAATVAGLVVLARRAPRLTALVGLWGLLPFLGSLLLIKPGGYVRYWEPALAVLCIPMAAGLLWASRELGRRVAAGAPRRAALSVAVAVALAIPALLLGRVLASPGTAHYPSLDDGQYVTTWAAGTGWEDVAAYLDRETGGAPFTIAYDRARPLWVFLSHWERAQQIPLGTPPAATARFMVKNYDGPLTPAEQAAFRLVRAFPRPRGGQPIQLYVHR